MNTKKIKEIALSTILFVLYIFVFLLTEMTINIKGTNFFGSNKTVILYSIGLICTSFGYLVFFLFSKIKKEEQHRKMIVASVTIVYMVCEFCFIFTASKLIFTATALISLILFGYIGGFTHYAVSLLLFEKAYTGRVIGTAIAIATILQFIVQNLFIVDIVLIISLTISVIGILYLVIKPITNRLFENPLPYSSTTLFSSKSFILPICIVAVMSLCFGLGDGLVTQLDAMGTIKLGSWARLVYALGVFIAGIIADFGNRRFLPLCTLCSLLLFSSMSLFIGEGHSLTSNIYMCVMYLFSGFYVMYLTLTFLDKAPRIEKTHLWAGMGRIIRGPFIALTAVLSTRLQDSIGQQGIAVLGVFLSLIVLVLMIFDKQLNIHAETTKDVSSRMSDFVTLYRFTPREAEIFSLLLDSDATNKDIAGELLISVRVLERYISSIYEKTGVSKRIELMNLYYNKIIQKDYTSFTDERKNNLNQSAVGVPVISEEKVNALAIKYSLTKRETQLLEMIYLRKTNEDIANELIISENTVKFHMKNLMKKLKVSSRNDIRELIDFE